MRIRSNIRAFVTMVFSGLASLAAPVANAQVRDIDPDTAIDGDLIGETVAPPAYATPVSTDPVAQSAGNGMPVDAETRVDTWSVDTIGEQAQASEAAGQTTYKQDDLLGAAEGVFGKGAEGLAEIIESILGKQGEPNGYIVGREGGGAFAVGLRYGSGTLYHKVEGNRPVYWTGPSLGFDVGLNAGNAFVLVYNLNDTQDLYKRFGAGEGTAYLVGGFNVSYLRRGNVVLIPVRMGAGVRLGANVGYMKFSEKQRWLPL